MKPAVRERVSRLSVTSRVFGRSYFRYVTCLGKGVYGECLKDNRIRLTAVPECEALPSNLVSYNWAAFVASLPARDRFSESDPLPSPIGPRIETEPHRASLSPTVTEMHQNGSLHGKSTDGSVEGMVAMSNPPRELRAQESASSVSVASVDLIVVVSPD
jgi:hypothetical protein